MDNFLQWITTNIGQFFNLIINTFLQWFITTVGQFFNFIINLLTKPIFDILNSLIPNFNTYFVNLTDFINNYVIKGIKFAKMSFVNALHIDHTIFNIVVIICILSFSIFIATRSLKLALNLWSIKDNGKTKN